MDSVIKIVREQAQKSNVSGNKIGCVIVGPMGQILGQGHNANIQAEHDNTEMYLCAELMALEEVSPHLLSEPNMCQASIVYVNKPPSKECVMHLAKNGFPNIQVVGGEFMKFDQGKPRYDLIPPAFIESVANVLTFGANKYEPNGWRKCEDLGRYEAAMMRHFEAYRKGEKLDSETGLPHIAHAITNLLFILELDDVA